MGEKMVAHLPAITISGDQGCHACYFLHVTLSWQNCSTFNVSKNGKRGRVDWVGGMLWEHERLNRLKGTLQFCV